LRKNLPDSSVDAVHRAPADFPSGKNGEVLTIGNGGEESGCGWCKDKWGLSWQITPIVLTKAITDPDPAVAKRAFDAMMTMKKIDVAAIEAARRG
jgi:predicted 3-demethylubiquinone-9 3-methyltransferase (glyoxalase superfamily)